MEKKLLERFTKKNCRKASRIKIRTEKLIDRKDDTLHVKWKVYDNSCNNGFDKNDIVI